MATLLQRSMRAVPVVAGTEMGEAGSAVKGVLLPWLAIRLLFLLITLTAPAWIAALHIPRVTLAVHDGLPTDRWYRWDALWYMRVATDGYRTVAYANHHLNLAFFPLYPLLLHLWFGVWPWSRVVAAMLVANLCSVAATYYLYRLVRLEYGGEWAGRVTWLLALFPTSLFLFTAYSEGLFLLCLAACFYNLRLQRWWWAALWGALGTLTRPLGIIVVAPYLICWYQIYGHQLRRVVALRAWRAAPHGRKLRRRLRVRLAARTGRWSAQRAPGAVSTQVLGALVAVTSVPAAICAYMVYLWARFGNPLAFSESQRSWHRTLAWPWEALQAAVTRPLARLPQVTPDQLHAGLDTLWGVVFLVLTIVAIRELGAVYGSFLTLFWVAVLSTPALLDNAADPLISLPRFLLTAFPLLIFLAATPRRAMIAAAISLPLLILNCAIFVAGGWVA